MLAAQPQPCLDPVLDCGQASLRQPGCQALLYMRRGNAGQRLAVPQPEGLVEQHYPVSIIGGVSRLSEQGAEPVHIDARRVRAQRVARALQRDPGVRDIA